MKQNDFDLALAFLPEPKWEIFIKEHEEDITNALADAGIDVGKLDFTTTWGRLEIRRLIMENAQ